MTPRLLPFLLVFLTVAACSGGDAQSLETSRARLAQHRKAYDWLAAELRHCGLRRLAATGQAADRCAGRFDRATLQSAMITLRVRQARLEGDEVWLQTGVATPVASWMIHTGAPGAHRPDPLTAAPHHWFYEARD